MFLLYFLSMVKLHISFVSLLCVFNVAGSEASMCRSLDMVLDSVSNARFDLCRRKILFHCHEINLKNVKEKERYKITS